MQGNHAPEGILDPPGPSEGEPGSAPEDLLREVRRHGPQPYPDLVAQHGRLVRILPLSRRPRLRTLITTYFPLAGFTFAQRFHNAYNLMRFLESYRVQYVEGVALTRDGGCLAHAWLALDGEHFDPTVELGLGDAATAGSDRLGMPPLRDYVALVALDQSGFRTCLHKRGVPWRGTPALDPPYAPQVLAGAAPAGRN